MKRPNLTAYFRGRIDWHVNGMMARTVPAPFNLRISGDVTDSIITATDKAGNVWKWEGGNYAARKVNGCYAPLMPKPIRD
jgi:hypothetical protein